MRRVVVFALVLSALLGCAPQPEVRVPLGVPVFSVEDAERLAPVLCEALDVLFLNEVTSGIVAATRGGVSTVDALVFVGVAVDVRCPWRRSQFIDELFAQFPDLTTDVAVEYLAVTGGEL